jgi:hypothetical protein
LPHVVLARLADAHIVPICVPGHGSINEPEHAPNGGYPLAACGQHQSLSVTWIGLACHRDPRIGVPWR